MNETTSLNNSEQYGNWDTLTLSNNFIFQKFMLNPVICKKVLSEILGKKVIKVEYPEYEKTISIRPDSKSIRLDVLLEGDNTIYNIEMQTANADHLPKRGRFYQDLIDLDLIEKGGLYQDLKRSFVIFICTFDYYKLNRYKYTFTYKCDEVDGLEYGDETVKIMINTKGSKGEVSKDFKDFLNAVNGVFSNSEFSATMKQEVDRIKNNDNWRREYMTLYLREQQLIRENQEKGWQKGHAEGLEQGLCEGREKGRAEGRAEGREKERKNAIRNMLKELPPEKIIGLGYEAELVMTIANEAKK